MPGDDNVGTKDTEYPSGTCQEDEEKSETVKENELEEQDDAEEPLGVPREAVIHYEVEHSVGVDGSETHREGEDVVEVVQGKELS